MKTEKTVAEKTADKPVEKSSATNTEQAILEEKLNKIIKHLEAIDWKIWMYLKANKYIDDKK